MPPNKILIIDVLDGIVHLYYLKQFDISEEEYLKLHEYNNSVLNSSQSDHPINIILNKLVEFELPSKKLTITEIIIIYRNIVF